MTNYNNPLLHEVESFEGAKHRINRLIQGHLRELAHVPDSTFVRNRLHALGVNTVGSDKTLLDYWDKQARVQMSVTHGVSIPRPKAKKAYGLRKQLGNHGIGFHTFLF